MKTYNVYLYQTMASCVFFDILINHYVLLALLCVSVDWANYNETSESTKIAHLASDISLENGSVYLAKYDSVHILVSKQYWREECENSVFTALNINVFVSVLFDVYLCVTSFVWFVFIGPKLTPLSITTTRISGHWPK